MVIFSGQFFIECGQIILGIGIGNVGDQFRTSSRDIHPSPEQIPGGTPLCRIGIRGGEVAAFEQVGDFIRIDFVIFCFAAVDGFHV